MFMLFNAFIIHNLSVFVCIDFCFAVFLNMDSVPADINLCPVFIFNMDSVPEIKVNRITVL